MKYLVDTDVVVDYLTGQAAAHGILQSILPDGIGISIITFSEVYEGIEGTARPARQQAETAFRGFLSRCRVVGISREVARHNARIRRELRSNRRPIDHRALDLLIAATALAHGLMLVTRNRRDYSDIPNLTFHPK